MTSVILSALFVLSTAVANVMQKKAMLGIGPVHGVSGDMLRKLLATPYLWAGMVAYAVALVLYLTILSRVPLNVATSIASLNFVAVLLASRLVLGEPIPPLRYLGFGCILLGLFVVAMTQRENP